MCMYDNPLRIKVDYQDGREDEGSHVGRGKYEGICRGNHHGVRRGCGVGCGGGARCGSSCCDHDGDGGGGHNSGKPRAKNHTLVSAMDIVEASGAFMDRNIVGSHVDVVGIGESQSQQGQSCNKHHVCG